MPAPIHVLMVEDSPDDAALLEYELRRTGNPIYFERVETADAMLAALRQKQWDIVLTDYSLPQFSAMAALSLLKQTGLDLPLIVVSGTIGEEQAVAAMRTGVNDYLVKDNLARLVPAIQRELREAKNRQAQRQAERFTKHLAAVVQSSGDAIISIDLHNRVVSWNPAAERIFGWSAAEAIGRHITFVVPPDRCAEFDEVIAFPHTESPVPAGDDGVRRSAVQLETIRLDKLGRRMEVSVTVAPIFDDEGRLVGAAKIVRDNSERKRDEHKLREWKSRYEAAIQATNQVLYDWNSLTGEHQWSGSCEETFGYTIAEMPRFLEDWFGLVHPDDREACRKSAARSAASALPSHTEYRVRRKDGQFIIVSDQGRFFRDSRGRAIHMIGFLADVTEQRRQRERLLDINQRYHLATRGGGVAIWEVDLRTGRVEYDAIVMEWLGVDSLKYPRTVAEWEAFHHPDEWPAILRRFHTPFSALSSGQSVGGMEQPSDSFEHRLKQADGKYRWVLSRGMTVRDGAGNPVRALGTIIDIHRRKLAESERDALLARLQMQFERMPIACIVIDRHGRYADWNPAAQRIFGYTREEALGRSPFDLIVPPSMRVMVEELLRRMLAGDMQVQGVGECLTKDGRLVACEWLNTPILGADGRVEQVYCMGIDVTERRRLEEQMRQAQKMQAIGQLAGGVAHDFNNLLTIINGYTQVLMQQFPPESNTWSLLNEIHEAGERSAALTRQLLAFSRKQVLSPQAVDVNAIVAGTEKMLHRMIGEDIELVTRLGTQLHIVYLDPGQLEQVLLNLAVNARDAMPRGGRITIETQNIELDVSFVRSRANLQPGPFVLLSFSDTGCGMTADVRAHLFEPFFTTKGPGKGTGLGLATVYGIVDQAGGHIEVDSEPGQGAAFRIYLPRMVPAAQAAVVGGDCGSVPAHTLDGPGAPACDLACGADVVGTETILVVEDDDCVRGVLRHVLSDCGYKVLEAGSGDDALRLTERLTAHIDLLITDVVMPNVSGRELAEQLVARHADMKVLFVSGYTDDAVVRHGILNQEVHFLQKPFGPFVAANKVREVLGKRKRAFSSSEPRA